MMTPERWEIHSGEGRDLVMDYCRSEEHAIRTAQARRRALRYPVRLYHIVCTEVDIPLEASP